MLPGPEPSRARGDRPCQPSWTFGVDCEVGQEQKCQNRQTSRMLQVPIICHDLNIEKAVLMHRQRFVFTARMSIELLTCSWTYLDFSSKTGERSEPGEGLGTVPVVLRSSRHAYSGAGPV